MSTRLLTRSAINYTFDEHSGGPLDQVETRQCCDKNGIHTSIIIIYVRGIIDSSSDLPDNEATHPHRELAWPNRAGEWVGLEMCNIQTGCGTLACFVLYLIDLNFVCGIPKLCLNPDIHSEHYCGRGMCPNDYRLPL